MCGIFGGIGIKNYKILKDMSKSILYRGPDKFNYFEDKKLFLGNNRLSIIDRKKGKQPFYSEDRNFVLVFNGTIFNFLEIKRYLEKKKKFLLKVTQIRKYLLILLCTGKKNVLNFLMACGLQLFMIEKKNI